MPRFSFEISKFFCAKLVLMGKQTIFYVNNDKSKEIKAAGILFYKKENNTVRLLMIKCNNKYEDFGGKTDVVDADIYETAAREAAEESNNIFNKQDLLNRLRLDDNSFVYNSSSKYALFILNLTDDEALNLSPELFGKKELHDNLDRTVEYVDAKLLLDATTRTLFNFRLLYYSLRNRLKHL